MVMARKPRPRKVLSRRRNFLGWAGYGTLGTVLSACGATELVQPWWIDYSYTRIAIRRLPAAFDGLRIAHLSDIHSNPVSLEEIESWVDRANHLGADLIALTGDFVTGKSRTNVAEVARRLGQLKAPLGVVACLGNHDYGSSYPLARSGHTAFGRFSRDALERSGVEVLVNGFSDRRRGNDTLHLAGCGDLWTGDFDMDFLSDAPSGPLVVLAHNPDTLYSLRHHNFDLMLSGHTHGGHVQCPFLGPPRLPIRHRHLAGGHYTYEHTQVYVSRGLGYLSSLRFRSRPELGIIELHRA